MKIGFIGLGNMGSAMIGGILKQKVTKKNEIFGSDSFFAAKEKAKKEYGITICDSNIDVVKEVDVLFLAVKPMYVLEVIREIREGIKEDTVIVSIVAGKSIAFLEEGFQKPVKLIRCMPNTPALVGEGCTAVSLNENVSDYECQNVLKILRSFGKAYEVPEKMMDAIVGVSGSAPAYVFLFIEAMADAGVKAGMPRKLAYDFSAQAVLGSAKMVLETGKHPGELKDMVCSPAGTTIEAVKVLEEMGFRGTVMDAVEACVEKSKNM